MSHAERTDDVSERYAEFETIDGAIVIYDRENSEAWIQSTETVSVGETRPLGPVAAEP